METRPNYSLMFLRYVLVGAVIYLILNDFAMTLDIDNIIKSAFFDVAAIYFWDLLYNNFLWKISFIRKMFKINTPLIYGRWEGYIESSYSDFKEKYPISIEFRQKKDFLKLTYYDEKAISYGISTDFLIDEGGSIQIFCIYRNEPIVPTNDFTMHYGTMKMALIGNTIQGIYSNFQVQRPTFGKIFLRFQSRKIKNRL